ncbi:MAG: hypothetical protein ABI379_02240 [Rhodanobacter sp.]
MCATMGSATWPAPGKPSKPVDQVAVDAFMGTDEERNLLFFRRDATGEVTGLTERRKCNDLRLRRVASQLP